MGVLVVRWVCGQGRVGRIGGVRGRNQARAEGGGERTQVRQT